MGGGLMQLVAYGAQDIYLTGNPQITFFKVVYRRHTNFSMEAIEQTWNGTSTADGRCTATISRNGDLVHRMYFEVTPSTPVANGGNFGASWITNVKLEIGGQLIDEHSGLWMETWAELTEPNPTGACATVAGTAVVGGTQFQKMSQMGGVCDGDSTATTAGAIWVPLQFWFCRNPGLALPLIALQYHEVKIILNHTIKTTLGTGGTPTQNLWVDYIYLDTDERRRFAQVSHEYLIEQVQKQSLTNGTGDLNFNHPVKELVWCASAKVNATAAPTSTPVGSASKTYLLKLNGHDRFAARDWRYFTRTQVYQHHSGSGGLTSLTNVADTAVDGRFDDSIGVYSFALKPEEHQPSGTCNFSRIDNARLEISAAATGVNTIFAVNYNVLRIMSGMGGLAYSN
jgi:hypothetical protein